MTHNHSPLLQNNNCVDNEEQLIKQLQSLIDTFHDEKLVDENESPNENRIYTLYEDGEITDQKGGWAYGRRTERIIVYNFSEPIHSYYKKCSFPKYTYNGLYGYLIATEPNINLIRDQMLKIIRCCAKAIKK